MWKTSMHKFKSDDMFFKTDCYTLEYFESQARMLTSEHTYITKQADTLGKYVLVYISV